jgi:hypothetical protein
MHFYTCFVKLRVNRACKHTIREFVHLKNHPINYFKTLCQHYAIFFKISFLFKLRIYNYIFTTLPVFKTKNLKGRITAVYIMEPSTTAHSITGYNVQSRYKIYHTNKRSEKKGEFTIY